MTGFRWLANFDGKNRRIYCFPSAGAGGSIYHKWRGSWPNHLTAVAITPPGRLHRLPEAALSDFDDYIEQLGAEIVLAEATVNEPNFSFFGHSLGALIAWEVGLWLRRRLKRGPSRIFVAASEAPSKRVAINASALNALTDAALVNILKSKYGTSSSEVWGNSEMAELALCAFRDDLRLASSYIHQDTQVASFDIHAIAGTEDPLATPREMELWRAKTSARFDLTTTPGAHDFFNRDDSPVLSLILSHEFG